MSRIEKHLFYLFILLLPTQLGKHFWPDFSIVSGIRIDYLSPTLYTTDVLVILLFCFFASRWFKSKKNSKPSNYNAKTQRKRKMHFVGGGLIVLFFFCNIVFSSDPRVSLYGAVKILEMAFVAFYLAKNTPRPFQLQKISFLFAVSSLFESLLAIAQYVNQGSLNGIFYFFGERTFTGVTPGIANVSLGGTLYLRPYATFPHPNVLAGYLLVMMIFIWHFLLQNNNAWSRSLSVMTLLLGSVALLLTFSRITILLWLLLAFYALIQVVRKSIISEGRKFLWGTIVVICLVIITVLPITHKIFVRFSQTSLSEESVTERSELLSASWKVIEQHTLFGVGINNFIPAIAPIQKPLPLGLYLQPVHNIFVLVLAESGVIGLGLFIWLLVAAVKRILKYELRIKHTVLLAYLVILVTGMGDHYWLTLQQGQLLLATLIGLSWMELKKASRTTS